MSSVIREPGSLERRSPVAAATWALFLGVLLLMLGNALQGALVGVGSQEAGFSLMASGVVMASYFAGFLIGSRYAMHVLAEVGHIRVFAALASSASAMVLAHTVFVSPLTWAIMRFIFGLCMAGIYVVIESWLNDMASNQTRGRLLSVYMVITSGALALGQFLLNIPDPDGFLLFIVASILVSLSLVPVSLSAASAPPVMARPQKMALGELVATVPTGVVSSFAVGAAAGIIMGMAPVYAALVEMPKSRISTFLAATMVGAVLAQWPIGWISDRVSRRGVILVVSIFAAAVSVLPSLYEPDAPELIGVMFLLGASVFPLYSLSVAYTNDWLRPERIVGASGLLIRVNGTGAISGPLLSSVLMNSFGPKYMFWTIGVWHAVIAVYVLYRMIIVEAMPTEQQRKFAPFPGRASATAARLLPRRRRTGVDLEQHRR